MYIAIYIIIFLIVMYIQLADKLPIQNMEPQVSYNYIFLVFMCVL